MQIAYFSNHGACCDCKIGRSLSSANGNLLGTEFYFSQCRPEQAPRRTTGRWLNCSLLETIHHQALAGIFNYHVYLQ
jgi:hypothetical protein